MDLDVQQFQNKNSKKALILENEIALIFNYIIPSAPAHFYAEKYTKGVEVLQLELQQQDELILKFIVNNKNCISFVDCGLRLFLKESVLKKRFLLAASIVESSPESFDMFLNSAPIKFPKLSFLWVGMQTLITLIIAFFLFKCKGWK